jgi:3-phosphoshikimate 1-carboxyvinyltransferase
LKIQGGKKLQGIHFHMPLASAQVKSCLLLAGIYAEGLTCLVEPTSSRDHTERLLTSFSYPLKKEANTLAIKADTELQATNIVIPGDISSAAFFIVAATLIPGSSIGIQQVGINPSRSAIITLLQMMGADITLSNSHFLGQEPVADIQVHYAPLKGIIVPVDLALIAIDEFPILCIAAAAAQGITVFRGLQELRVKESDRIKAIAEGLTTLGIKNTTYEDGLVIEGGKIQGGQVNSFNDHRIAMAFAIAGIIAADPVTIQNIEKVSTSFPHFIKTAQKIGIDLQEICHDY